MRGCWRATRARGDVELRSRIGTWDLGHPGIRRGLSDGWGDRRQDHAGNEEAGLGWRLSCLKVADVLRALFDQCQRVVHLGAQLLDFKGALAQVGGDGESCFCGASLDERLFRGDNPQRHRDRALVFGRDRPDERQCGRVRFGGKSFGEYGVECGCKGLGWGSCFRLRGSRAEAEAVGQDGRTSVTSCVGGISDAGSAGATTSFLDASIRGGCAWACQRSRLDLRASS